MQGIVNEKKLYIYMHKNINICIGLKPWKRTVLHSFFLVLPFGSSREACLVMSCHLILWNTDTTNDNKSEWWLSMPNCVPQAEIHPLFQSPLGLYAAPWLPIHTQDGGRISRVPAANAASMYRMSMGDIRCSRWAVTILSLANAPCTFYFCK